MHQSVLNLVVSGCHRPCKLFGHAGGPVPACYVETCLIINLPNQTSVSSVCEHRADLCCAGTDFTACAAWCYALVAGHMRSLPLVAELCFSPARYAQGELLRANCLRRRCIFTVRCAHHKRSLLRFVIHALREQEPRLSVWLLVFFRGSRLVN
jgi:hypothetical protein